MAENSAVAQRLLLMKQKIEDAETQAAQLTGRIDGLQERMRAEHGVNSLAEAEAALARMDAELSEMEAALAEEIKPLEAALLAPQTTRPI